ncbi:MAG: MerC domain-containing protein [Myxococcales bacterium]|nr:MerC domain-containing protein [Myxococcales bacterium]
MSHVHASSEEPHHHHASDPPDTLGQVLSAVCAVHCVATPFLLGLLPAAASVLGGAHPVLLVVVTGVALWAFIPGYRCHRAKHVLGLALGGIAFLALGALVFHDDLAVDTGLSLVGATLMMTAHWRNRVLLRRAH